MSAPESVINLAVAMYSVGYCAGAHDAKSVFRTRTAPKSMATKLDRAIKAYAKSIGEDAADVRRSLGLIDP